MSINIENISHMVSGCMDLLENKSVLRLQGPIWTAILCSGCMDLYDHHFVLRFHRPIRLPFCTQVTWTYMIAILCSGCMDLYDLDYKHFISINFENISLLVSGCMDLLANKKVCSCCMDLFGLS